jgi:hypothetical protein
MRFLFFLHLASTGIVYFQINLVLILAPRLIFAGIQYRYKLGSGIIYGKYVPDIDLET